ncbi:MAG TPA: M48 family metalloprotease [Candidatus Acidoferrales bacterium]|nr:M48 family metalloprotease [Candidatus Acidoferrales bacterium]
MQLDLSIQTLLVADYGKLAVDSEADRGQEATSYPPGGDQLAQFVKNVWLLPILEDLKRRSTSTGNERLSTLLHQLELRVVPLPQIWGPNAVATCDEKTGQPIVYADLVFLSSLLDIGDLAGLFLTQAPQAGPILRSVGQTYGQALRNARELHTSAPPLEFKLSSVQLEPWLQLGAQRLATDAVSSAMAWVLLHEVGHHMLHFRCRSLGSLQGQATNSKQSISLEDQRQRELEADGWAFSNMEALGYGLSPIQAILYALETGEKLRSLSGFGLAESDSDHPSWSTRRKALEAHHDVSKAPRGRIIILGYITGEDRQHPLLGELWLPRGDPDYNGDLYALCVVGDQPVQRLAYEWINGEAHLYGKDERNYQETVIGDPDSYYPKISTQLTSRTGGPGEKLTTKGFQLSIAPLAQGGKGIVSNVEMLNTPPSAAVTATFAAISHLDPSTRAAAEQVWRNLVVDTRQLLISNAKGLLSDTAMQAQFQKARGDARLHLSKLLGDDGLAQFDHALVANPFFQYALSGLTEAKP